jgi:hypothetical protein
MHPPSAKPKGAGTSKALSSNRLLIAKLGARKKGTAESSKLIPLIAIAAVAGAIYMAGVPGILSGSGSRHGTAWATQVFGAALAWAALIVGFRGPLRISNAGTLALSWMTIYLILPSLEALRGNQFLVELAERREEILTELFFYHAQLFIGFGAVYGLLNRLIPTVQLEPKREWHSNGRWILGISTVPLFYDLLVRVLSGEGILPSVSYGDSWTNVTDYYSAAQGAGGVLQVIAQLRSKTSVFVMMLQGLGAGLIMTDMLLTRERKSANFLILLGFFGVTLTLGAGGRSGVLLVGLMGIYICDRFVGPLKWRHLLPALLVVGLAFEFYGHFRTYRGLGMSTAVRQSVASLRVGESQFGEFLLMLPKEERGLDLFRDAVDPLEYILACTTNFLPSQIAPWKGRFEGTANALSLSLLGGDAVRMGGGVAGAIIVDGFRLGGSIGNAIIGSLLALLYFGVQYWEVKEVRSRASMIPLYKLVLCAGFSVNAVNVVRGDLPSIIGFIVYYVVTPGIIITLLLPGIAKKYSLRISSVK